MCLDFAETEVTLNNNSSKVSSPSFISTSLESTGVSFFFWEVSQPLSRSRLILVSSCLESQPGYIITIVTSCFHPQFRLTFDTLHHHHLVQSSSSNNIIVLFTDSPSTLHLDYYFPITVVNQLRATPTPHSATCTSDHLNHTSIIIHRCLRVRFRLHHLLSQYLQLRPSPF
ncbi:hypothetical protein HanRHA438_Chr12g0556301 [Helianthus annuus]|nr:hypothetical protein HanRHA438_Chr12g0556301 [Helianthus annuus]